MYGFHVGLFWDYWSSSRDFYSYVYEDLWCHDTIIISAAMFLNLRWYALLFNCIHLDAYTCIYLFIYFFYVYGLGCYRDHSIWNIEYCEHHIIISAYMFTFPIKNFQPKMKKERVILPLFEESFMYFFFL
jgi:hypothetical protein